MGSDGVSGKGQFNFQVEAKIKGWKKVKRRAGGFSADSRLSELTSPTSASQS